MSSCDEGDGGTAVKGRATDQRGGWFERVFGFLKECSGGEGEGGKGKGKGRNTSRLVTGRAVTTHDYGSHGSRDADTARLDPPSSRLHVAGNGTASGTIRHAANRRSEGEA